MKRCDFTLSEVHQQSELLSEGDDSSSGVFLLKRTAPVHDIAVQTQQSFSGAELETGIMQRRSTPVFSSNSDVCVSPIGHQEHLTIAQCTKMLGDAKDLALNVVTKVGEGGYGKVYHCQSVDGISYAVKLALDTHIEDFLRNNASFSYADGIGLKLDHENIIKNSCFKLL